MNWIILAAALEVGWMPLGDFVMHDPPSQISITGSFYVDMEVRAEVFDHLFLGGEVKTLMYKIGDGYYFMPERMLYQFTAGIFVDNFEIGIRHYCTHPIQPYLWQWNGPARWEGSYEEVYLRVGVDSGK